MLNALLVTTWPEIGWSRIANRESYRLTFACVEWLFVALVSCVIEGLGMIKLGAGTNSIGSVYNLSMDTIVGYEVKYIVSLMFFLVLAAVIVHCCIRGSLENVKFQTVLTVILYLSCSVLFMKILDAFPYVHTWVCFALSICMIGISAYSVIPIIFCPNITDGFSIFILVSMILSLKCNG